MALEALTGQYAESHVVINGKVVIVSQAIIVTGVFRE